MSRKWLRCVAVWMLAVLVLAWGFHSPSPAPAQQAKRPGGRPAIRQGDLQDGDPAPAFTLTDATGKSTVKLADLKGKPVVLVFGSCTCPPFVAATRQTEKLYARYGERVHFYLIYTREAHPTDGRAIAGNAFEVKSPRSLEERLQVARDFVKEAEITMPVLVDGIDDATEKAYATWPNRLFILDATGKIVDKGTAGPGGTSLSARRAEEVLDKLLGPR